MPSMTRVGCGSTGTRRRSGCACPQIAKSSAKKQPSRTPRLPDHALARHDGQDQSTDHERDRRHGREIVLLRRCLSRYAVLRGTTTLIAWRRVLVATGAEPGLPEVLSDCFENHCQCRTCSTRSHTGRASATTVPTNTSGSIAPFPPFVFHPYSIRLPPRRLELAVRYAEAVPGGSYRRIKHLRSPGVAGADLLPVSGGYP